MPATRKRYYLRRRKRSRPTHSQRRARRRRPGHMRAAEANVRSAGIRWANAQTSSECDPPYRRARQPGACRRTSVPPSHRAGIAHRRRPARLRQDCAASAPPSSAPGSGCAAAPGPGLPHNCTAICGATLPRSRSLQIVEAFRLSFVPGEAVTCTLGGCSKAVRILRRLAPISADELSQSASEARRWLQPPRSVDPFGTTRRRGPVQPSARLLIAEHVR